METIGFIGLGRMGRPMASNLCRKGFRLVVNDIDPAAVQELEAFQARRRERGGGRVAINHRGDDIAEFGGGA